jgi:hypothetical protein
VYPAGEGKERKPSAVSFGRNFMEPADLSSHGRRAQWLGAGLWNLADSGSDLPVSTTPGCLDPILTAPTSMTGMPTLASWMLGKK